MRARSWLFVPGDAPDKMEKARAGDADAIILDLEDSIAPERKEFAHTQVVAFLKRHAATSPGRLWVRTLAAGRAGWAEEAAPLVAAGAAGLVLPKPAGRGDILKAARVLERLESEVGAAPGSTRLFPILETPAAVLAAWRLESLPARVAFLSWGAADLSLAVGAAPGVRPLGGPLELARGICLLAAAAAGIGAVETLHPSFEDDSGLAAMAERAAKDGFLGMIAIHPRQTPIINAAFAPRPADLEWAQQVIEAFAAHPGVSALRLAGRMLDEPDLAWARRTMLRADGPAAPPRLK